MDAKRNREENYESNRQMRLRRWKRQTALAIEAVFQKSYPPGYEYKKEGVAACFLMGIGVVWNFRFFESLYTAQNYLYMYININGEPIKMVVEEARPFTQVAEGYWGYFTPLLLFLVFMAVYHYFYYYRESKSIYLMRRLPKRSALFMSCIQGPLLWAGMAAVVAVVLYLLYFGIYLLVMPAESMPRFM